MKKYLALLLLFVCSGIGNVTTAQLSDEEREELIKVSARILKPDFNYQYNIVSSFVKQNVKERTGSFFMSLNPNDTLEWKKKLKNDTSDAPICFNLFLLYKSINKFNSAKFYLHKSLYLYEQKLKYNPTDTLAALKLAVLYSSNNDFEGAKRVYKILAKESDNKEFPYMMLSMMYMSRPDSMEYYIKEFDLKAKDDYKKMLVYTLLRTLQFAINYDEKDSTIVINKHYKELSDWGKADALYEKNKSNFKYELIYNAVRTYSIILQASIVSESVLPKYEKELSEIEKYYLDFIKDKQYTNKTIPYLSLSAIYTIQKKYDKALNMQKALYDHIRKYNITDTKESEEIISSYIGLFEMAKKYKEGAAYTRSLVDSNVYHIDFRKAYIYFLYKSGGDSKEILAQAAKISTYDPSDIYPQLVYAYESLSKKEYEKMFGFLKDAYSKNSSKPEIFAFMAVLSIINGKKADAEKSLSQIESLMPETAEKLRKFIK
jgi:hypothetical protein